MECRCLGKTALRKAAAGNVDTIVPTIVPTTNLMVVHLDAIYDCSNDELRLFHLVWHEPKQRQHDFEHHRDSVVQKNHDTTAVVVIGPEEAVTLSRLFVALDVPFPPLLV